MPERYPKGGPKGGWFGEGSGGVLGCLGGSKEKSGGVLKSSGGSEGIPPPPPRGVKGIAVSLWALGLPWGGLKRGWGES